MAWTSVYSTDYIIKYMVSYGSNLCWQYTNLDIYIWNGVSESATQIFTLTDSHISGGTALSNFTKFNGNLYLSLAGSFDNGDPGCRIYKYSGTPHSWSEVLSIESESGLTCGYTMTATNEKITIDISDSDSSYDRVIKSSIDGTSWENDTFNQDWIGGVYSMFSDFEGNIYGETYDSESNHYLIVKLATGNTWSIHTNITSLYTLGGYYSQNNGFTNLYINGASNFYYYKNDIWNDTGIKTFRSSNLMSVDYGESNYDFVSNWDLENLYYWNTSLQSFEIFDELPVANKNITSLVFFNNVLYSYSDYNIYSGVTVELPVITSIPAVLAYVGIEYSYNITTTGNVTSITATYPDWLVFTDNEDGTATLIGTPTTEDVDTFSIHISAINGFGEDTQDYTITVVTQNYKMLSMSIPITSNTMVLCTEFSNGNLILSNKNSVVWGNQIILGTCKLSDVGVTYCAYVLALDTATYYVYGRFTHPELGLCHIIKTEDSGVNWKVVVNDWGTAVCAALLFDRQTYMLYAIRESSSTHILYKGSTKLVSKCIIPMGDNKIDHGNFVMDSKKNLYIASYTQNEIAVMKSLAPGYTEWVDITFNHDVNGINRILVTL